MIKQIVKLLSIVAVLSFLVWPAITQAQEPFEINFFFSETESAVPEIPNGMSILHGKFI